MAIWNTFLFGDLGYFMTLWYILYSFGTFFPVLVSCTKKNLATLQKRVFSFPTEDKKLEKINLGNVKKVKAQLSRISGTCASK
jgi:hypothetical protein